MTEVSSSLTSQLDSSIPGTESESNGSQAPTKGSPTTNARGTNKSKGGSKSKTPVLDPNDPETAVIRQGIDNWIEKRSDYQGKLEEIITTGLPFMKHDPKLQDESICKLLTSDEIIDRKEAIYYLIAPLVDGNKLALTRLLNSLKMRLAMSAKEHSILISELITDENVNQIAERKSYGIKEKDAIRYEDESENALWMWEVTNFKYLPEIAAARLTEYNELKKQRTSVSQKVKALSQLLALVSKAESAPSKNILAKINDEAEKFNRIVRKEQQAMDKIQEKKRKREELEQQRAAKKLKMTEKKQDKAKKAAGDRLIDLKALQTDTGMQQESKLLSDAMGDLENVSKVGNVKDGNGVRSNSSSTSKKDVKAQKITSFFVKKDPKPITKKVENSVVNSEKPSEVTDQTKTPTEVVAVKKSFFSYLPPIERKFKPIFPYNSQKFAQELNKNGCVPSWSELKQRWQQYEPLAGKSSVLDSDLCMKDVEQKVKEDGSSEQLMIVTTEKSEPVNTLATKGKKKYIFLFDSFKKSKCNTVDPASVRINPRRPFHRYDQHVDYDIDSEEEFEEENAEDLKSDEDEDEEEAAESNDAEGGDKWIVPDGYLSEDEAGENAGESHSNVQGHSGQRRYISLKIGDCVYGKDTATDVILDEFRICPLTNEGTVFPLQITYERGRKSEEAKTETKGRWDSAALVNKYYVEFVLFIHGSPKSKTALAEEFASLHPECSKRQSEKKIKEISVKEKRGTDTKPRYYVNSAIFKELGIEEPEVAPLVVESSVTTSTTAVVSTTAATLEVQKNVRIDALLSSPGKVSSTTSVPRDNSASRNYRPDVSPIKLADSRKIDSFFAKTSRAIASDLSFKAGAGDIRKELDLQQLKRLNLSPKSTPVKKVSGSSSVRQFRNNRSMLQLSPGSVSPLCRLSLDDNAAIKKLSRDLDKRRRNFLTRSASPKKSCGETLYDNCVKNDLNRMFLSTKNSPVLDARESHSEQYTLRPRGRRVTFSPEKELVTRSINSDMVIDKMENGGEQHQTSAFDASHTGSAIKEVEMDE